MASQAAEDAGLAKKVDPLQSYIVKGVVSQLNAVLGIPIALSTSSDSIFAVEKLFSRFNKPIAYPYGYTRLTSLSVSDTKLNNRSTTMRGAISLVSDDENIAYSVMFLAATFDFSIVIESSNWADILNLSARILMARTKQIFNFTVSYGRSTFNIQLRFPDRLDLPERPAESDVTPQQYRAEWTFIVEGFISDDSLQEVQVAHTIQVDTSLASLDPFDGSLVLEPVSSVTSSRMDNTVSTVDYPSRML